MILIVDDFLTEESCEDVLEEVMGLQYSLHCSDLRVRSELHMMAAKINFNNTHCRHLFNSLTLLSEVEGNTLFRAYANLAPAGVFYRGEMHQDDGLITALYYPQQWDKMWGGGTEFEDGTIVDYKRNRLVLFDASIRHKACAHNSPHGWRFTVAYKTGMKWTEEESNEDIINRT